MEQPRGRLCLQAPLIEAGGDRPQSQVKYTTTLSPSERTLRARIGAYSLHATHDPRETTAKARETFLNKFLDEVDPDRTLPEPERLRRAEAARKAHFAKLALRSAQARRKGKSSRKEGA